MIRCGHCGHRNRGRPAHCKSCGEPLHVADIVLKSDVVLISDALQTQERRHDRSEPDTEVELRNQDTVADHDALASESLRDTMVDGSRGTAERMTFAPPEPDTSPALPRPPPSEPRQISGVYEVVSPPPKPRRPAPQPREVHLVVVLGRGITGEYRFHSGVVSLGRDSLQDVVLDNPSVSRQHCKLRISGERAVIEDLRTPNGTTVNSRSIRRAELRPGDEIGIGKFTVLFRPSNQQLALLEARSRAPAAAMHGAEDLQSTTFLSISEVRRLTREQAEEHAAHLKVVAPGRRRGRRFPLYRTTTVLGNSIDADVPLSGWFISGRHVLIVKRARSYRLIHAAGIRPVWVNGRPVKECTLRNRDQIRVAGNTFNFFCEI
jgi:pSer/pThr/pTyr-binding forkhead associated (FHA) protein